MNAVLLLMGLLVLSYLGSFLMTRRAVGGAGLPSGVEYAALGFVLGPQALDFVGADNLSAFEPVVQVAIGWLAFGVGLSFGFARGKRVRLTRLLFGTFSALVTGLAVAGASLGVLILLRVALSPSDRVLLAGGIGAAASETTRYAVSWLVERYAARGALAETLNDVAHADSLLPLIAVSVLFALRPTHEVLVPLPVRDWPAITAAMGFGLGAGAALLLRSEMRVEDTWAVLFGVCLLAIGTAARLGLSTLTACCFMGIAVSALSPHGRELRLFVEPTERPVLLPALLLAGARLDFRALPALPWIAGAAIAARMLVKILLGVLLASRSGVVRKAGPLVGLSLMSSGALAMCVGLAFALRFPGPVGDTVLVVAVAAATVGEFVGPPRLRKSLQLVGEIEDTAPHRIPASSSKKVPA